jgi:hypothetical protein
MSTPRTFGTADSLAGQAACRELGLVSSTDAESSSAGGDTSGGGMPLKASVVTWSHCRSVSRVRSRRSTATTVANREGSAVTTGTAEDNHARVARPAPAMAFDQCGLGGLAIAPRFLTTSGSALSVSFARHWHQMMIAANTMNTSAKSTGEAIAAKTRSSTSDAITTPHHPTAPARPTLLRSDKTRRL